MKFVLPERHETEDSVLVLRCLSGDRTAWRELILRYERLIHSIVGLYFADPATAEEAFEDIARDLHRRLDDLRDLGSIRAWVTAAARRRCRAFQNGGWADPGVSSDPAIEADIEAIEARFNVERAMTRLSADERALIEALYLHPDRPSDAETASRLNLPVSSIGPMRARCVEKLCLALETIS